MSRLNKKAYYFTLDALIALVILSIGFIVITASYSYTPAAVSTQHLADGILNLLQSAKISDFCDPVTCNLPISALGTNPFNYNNTLLELTGELEKRGAPDKDKIKDLLQNSIDLIMNSNYPNYNYAFQLIGTTTYFYSSIGASNMLDLENNYDEYKKTKLLVSSKRIVLGYYLDASSNAVYWGPYTAEVRVWQK